MKKLTLIVIAILFNFSVEAQIYNQDFRDIQNVLDINSSVNVKDNINADGSPYVQDMFQPIKLKGVDAYITAKFNAYIGQMHLKVNDEIISLNVNGDYEVKFTNHNKTYKTFSYNSLSRKTNRGFLVIVKETDQFKLLKEEIISFKDKVPAKNTYVREVPAKFIQESDTYYFMLNDKIVHFPTKKKKLLKAFPKKGKKLKSYIKDNKLSTKKEEDMIKIAEYISSISNEKKDNKKE